MIDIYIISLKRSGPFDLLAAKKSGRGIPEDADVHLHWRFFFDPPEFMTILNITSSDAADHEQLEGNCLPIPSYLAEPRSVFASSLCGEATGGCYGLTIDDDYGLNLIIASFRRAGLHYGYFRDDPSVMPTFVASSSKDLGNRLYCFGMYI